LRLDRDKLNRRRKSRGPLPVRNSGAYGFNSHHSHDAFSSKISNVSNHPTIQKNPKNPPVKKTYNNEKHKSGRHKLPSISLFTILLLSLFIILFTLLFNFKEDVVDTTKNKLLLFFGRLTNNSSEQVSTKDILLDFGYETRITKIVDVGDGLIGIGTVMVDENKRYQALFVKLDYKGNIVWKRLVGEEGDEFAYDILKESDGYVLLGISSSKSLGVNGRYDVVVSKFSDNGELLWQKLYGNQGWDRAYRILEVHDSYVFAGDSEASGEDDDDQESGLEEFWIMKLTKDGKIVWSNMSGGILSDRLYAMGYLKSLNLVVVAGSTNSFTDGSQYEGYVGACNLNGNIEWQAQLSVSSSSTLWPLDLITTDNSIYVGGYVYEPSDNNDKLGIEKAFIAKLSKLGQVEYIKTFGENCRVQSITHFQKSSENNDVIYFAGYKYDENKKMPWYGSFEYSEGMDAPKLKENTLGEEYGMLYFVTENDKALILSGSTMKSGKLKGLIRIISKE